LIFRKYLLDFCQISEINEQGFFIYFSDGWNIVDNIVNALGFAWGSSLLVARLAGRARLAAFTAAIGASATPDLIALNIWGVGEKYLQAQALVRFIFCITYIQIINKIK
jgi:hypothetical protein